MRCLDIHRDGGMSGEERTCANGRKGSKRQEACETESIKDVEMAGATEEDRAQ